MFAPFLLLHHTLTRPYVGYPANTRCPTMAPPCPRIPQDFPIFALHMTDSVPDRKNNWWSAVCIANQGKRIFQESHYEH